LFKSDHRNSLWGYPPSQLIGRFVFLNQFPLDFSAFCSASFASSAVGADLWPLT